MLARKLAAAAIGAAILGVAVTASADALSSRHRTTYVTFPHAVALPGVELAAGTYIFELPLPDEHLNLVRVLSRDRKKVYLTQFTQTIQRPPQLDPTRAIAYNEATRGKAPTVKAWFPEFDATGRQFVYR